MYQFSYSDVLEDTPQHNRANERRAIERSIELLRKAELNGPGSAEAVEALEFVMRLWSIVLEDLAKPDNELPKELRASIISIGLWILGEAEQIRQERSANFAGLIAVSQSIADGLQ